MGDVKTFVIDGKDVRVEGDVANINLMIHRTISDSPEIRVKLSKMSKGYQWEISAEGPDPGALLIRLENVDKELRLKFGSEE